MIGQEQDSLGWDFDASAALDGEVDKLTIYGRALLASEIASIYASGAGGKCRNDFDADGVLNAHDDCSTSPDVYPGAPEINDGLDNQCPGDTGHGLVDEIGDALQLEELTDHTDLSWTAQPGATGYEVARSPTRDFSVDCTLFSVSSTSWNEFLTPPPGGCHYYLARAAAPNAGSWGAGTAGERTLVCEAFTCPVSWWPADGNAVDAVGPNDGSLENGATYGSGQFGQAFSLDGIDDYVAFGDVLDEIDVPFTVEAWIHTPGGTLNPVFTSDAEVNYYGFRFFVGSDDRLEILYGDGGGPAPPSRRSKVSAASVPLDTWTHVAAVVRGETDMKLYIDGVDAGGTYSGSGGPMVHGSGEAHLGEGFGLFFEGWIDDAAVYDSDLSQAEVQLIVAGGLSYVCQP